MDKIDRCFNTKTDYNSDKNEFECYNVTVSSNFQFSCFKSYKVTNTPTQIFASIVVVMLCDYVAFWGVIEFGEE